MITNDADNARVLADLTPAARFIYEHGHLTQVLLGNKDGIDMYSADQVSALKSELQSEENRSELFSSLLNDIAKAIGKNFGDSHHDLAAQVSALIQRNEALEAQKKQAMRDVLEEPEQEPAIYAVFAWGRLENTYHTRDGADLIRSAYPENACASVAPLYTSPQPREWQELSEDGINETFRTAACKCLDGADSFRRAVYTAISASLRAKNRGAL